MPSHRVSSADDDDHVVRRAKLESNASRLFLPSGGKLELIDLLADGTDRWRVARQVSESSHLDGAVGASVSIFGE